MNSSTKVFFGVAFLVAGLSGCASKKSMNTADALKELNARYSEKVGKAAKTELVEEFGSAAWCEQKPGDTETCRFYRSLGTQWRGDKEARTKYEAFDEIIADFDAEGILRDYKARSQR